MRCSKVKLIAVLLIFGVVVGLQLLLSHSEGNVEQGSHLTGLLSRRWRSSELKSRGETWISGKLLPLISL